MSSHFIPYMEIPHAFLGFPVTPSSDFLIVPGGGVGLILFGPSSGLVNDREDLVTLSQGHDGAEIVGDALHFIEHVMHGIVSASDFQFAQTDSQAVGEALFHLVREVGLFPVDDPADGRDRHTAALREVVHRPTLLLQLRFDEFPKHENQAFLLTVGEKDAPRFQGKFSKISCF